MNVFLQLLLALLFGTLCADQARKRGRYSTVWFFLGALFNLFALATLFILPSLLQGAEVQEDRGKEGNRFGNSPSSGSASGLSSSSAFGSSSGMSKSSDVSSGTESASEFPYVGDPRCRRWFFIDITRVQQGPVPFRNLHNAWDQKQLSEESYVWTEGMPEWRPIRTIPALFEQLQLFS